MFTHVVVHIGTGVNVGSFKSEEEARYWIEQLGVTQSYKDQFYRVIPWNEWCKRVDPYWDENGPMITRCIPEAG